MGEMAEGTGHCEINRDSTALWKAGFPVSSTDHAIVIDVLPENDRLMSLLPRHRRLSRAEEVLAALTLYGWWLLFAPLTLAFAVWMHPSITTTVRAVLPGWVLIAIALRLLTIRSRRRLREHNGLLCMTCGHSLVGLPVRGRCPECARGYVHEEVQDFWRSSYGPTIIQTDCRSVLLSANSEARLTD